MFPVATNGGGQFMAFPDVCKTPTPAGPAPLPYPNMGQGSDGEGSKKVKIDNKETLRKGDSVRMTAGDEAGSVGGVVSSKIKGKVDIVMGWPSVKAEGKEVAHLLASSDHNGSSPGNTAVLGKYIAPGQTKVKVMKVKGVRRRVHKKVRKYHPSRDASGQDPAFSPTPQMKKDAKTAAKSTDATKKKKASEDLGDGGAQNAGEEMAKRDYQGLAKPPQSPTADNPISFGGRSTTDVVTFCKDGTILIFEAKGGASPLGTAMAGTKRMQQGTPKYLDEILDRMEKAGGDKKAVADKIKAQMQADPSKVRYCEARTEYDANGDPADTVIKEFDP